MDKRYSKPITKCEECHNILYIPAISPNTIREMRCTNSRYRKNVYRLIHHDRVNVIPHWCELPDAEILDPPF